MTCPLLQLHGARDDIVPLALGRKLFTAARPKSATGITKRLIELPNGGHNDMAESELVEPIRQFFEEIDGGNGS